VQSHYSPSTSKKNVGAILIGIFFAGLLAYGAFLFSTNALTYAHEHSKPVNTHAQLLNLEACDCLDSHSFPQRVR
jgi:hypothetical protein